MTTIMVQKAEHFTRSTTGRGGNCGCGEGVGTVWTVPITPTPSIAFQHLLCVINQCLEFAHHHVGIVMFRTVARREKHTGTLKALLHFRHCGCARIDYTLHLEGYQSATCITISAHVHFIQSRLLQAPSKGPVRVSICVLDNMGANRWEKFVDNSSVPEMQSRICI